MCINIYRMLQATLLLFLMVLTAGCLKDSCNRNVPSKIYTPVYRSLADIRSAVKDEAPRAIEQAGKIYLYGKYILLNEPGTGIHVIDNTSPSAPKNIAFINIPGNVDMAVKDNILYADSYIDLVALDISDPLNAREVERVKGAFGTAQYQYGLYTDTTKGIIMSFEVRDTVIHYTCENNWNGAYYDTERNILTVASSSGASAPAVIGKAGSTATFGLTSNYLYTLSNFRIQTFNVQQAAKPVSKGSVMVNGTAGETIFPYRQSLYIGGSNGMAIYDISNPETPSFKSLYQHFTGCDPVVVQNDIAYVTIRSSSCTNAAANTLEAIDVKNPLQPALLKSYTMLSPYGLGIDNKSLFVCEGNNGLRCMDATDPLTIATIRTISDIKPFEIIPENNGVVLVTAADGLYQYNLQNLQSPVLLSKLSITTKK